MFYYIFYYNKNNEVRIKCFENDLVATGEFVRKIREEGVINLKVKESLNGLYYSKMNPVGGVMPIHFVLTEQEFDALQGEDITKKFESSLG